jgi:peptidoglycan hydrolase CwlO-like protein
MENDDPYYLDRMADAAYADGWSPSLSNYMREAAEEISSYRGTVRALEEEIERLRAQLKICTAERDHHQKWSKNYEQEIYKLRDQIKKKNSN